MRIKHVALAFLLATGAASTASATDFNHDGVVDIFAALDVAETAELDFGTVQLITGTVTLGTGNSITADPNTIHIGDAVVSGVYTVTGEANQTVDVSLSGSVANGLTLGNFSSSPASLANLSLGAGGSTAVTIGADLTVDAGTASTGGGQLLAFTVTVTYN